MNLCSWYPLWLLFLLYTVNNSVSVVLSIWIGVEISMEALLTECVQNSLGQFMHHNAIFMCQRLCTEFPSEVHHTFSPPAPFFSTSQVFLNMCFIMNLGWNAVIRFHFLGYIFFFFSLLSFSMFIWVVEFWIKNVFGQKGSTQICSIVE